MNQNYFVQVKNHADVRTRALQASKRLVYASQTYYKLLEIHKQKHQHKKTLQESLNVILQDWKELQEILPHHELAKKTSTKATHTQKKQENAINASQKQTTPSQEKQPKNIQELQKTLAEIEQKLQAI